MKRNYGAYIFGCMLMLILKASASPLSPEFSSIPEYISTESTDDPQPATVNACPPVNNTPCYAIYVPLGGVANGNNTCADSVNEPYNPAQCRMIPGTTINTVWYKAVVPLSNSISVRTHPLTLQNTQIQAYRFPGGCSDARNNFVSLGCNDTGTACLVNDIGYHTYSELFLTGLIPGDTIYIAVDGIGSQTGTFDITFKDGTSGSYPPVYRQDCAYPEMICGSSDIVVPDPGFQNTGNICDLTSGLGCWGIGERNSVWYQFTVDPALSGGTATVTFDISSLPTTDIDFMVWNVTGMSNACQQIQAFALQPDACNFYTISPLTGIATWGTGVPTPYSPALVFSGPPRTFLMLINDFNSAGQAGYTIDWNSTPISNNTSTIWTGATDSLFATSTNWGNCSNGPACSTDANIVYTSNGRQPIVTGTKSVKNINISSGATLTLQSGSILQVCGNFTNQGTLICNQGSTIKFINAANQTVSGLLTGTNSFANLVVAKSGGNVQLLDNIDVSEDFSTINGSSIFNINGKYMKVGGDFSNNSGNTTFTGTNFSTVEFYKSSNQDFTNSFGSIVLHKVTINKPAGAVYLRGLNSTMNIDSLLKLTKGRIVTRDLSSLEVNVQYFQPSAIIGHNPLSYIDGVLRRKIANGVAPVTGTWDFPVGDSSVFGGYELAQVSFTVSTTIPDLRATFTPWPSSTPPTKGPNASECVIATYSALPILDNGYWTILRSNNNYSGNYNLTLRNTGVTNSFGSGWTVTCADTSLNPNSIASWILLGTCVPASTEFNTIRNNFNPSNTALTTFNRYYATAQTGTTLPIELLYFSAEPERQEVICNWETSSETNNEYFEVERSFDAKIFEPIGRVNGYGQGSSTENRFYTLTDRDRCDGIRYYKLKQVDIDGHFSYSDIVAVNCTGDRDLFRVYPNPGRTDIICTFYENNDGVINVVWRDILGEIVKQESHIVQKGINTIQTNVSDLAKGIYFMQLIESDTHPNDTNRQIKFLIN